jgi:hypothetical protein
VALAIYTQTIIAMIWDFDRTLIRGYSPEPIFRKFGIDPERFWAETRELQSLYHGRGIRVGDDTAYLNHLLSYVKAGQMPGLTNETLKVLGADLECCPGIPAFLDVARELAEQTERYAKHEIRLEHYVVSTGIRQLIEGSSVGGKLSGVWANEFIDQPPEPGFSLQGHTFGPPGEIAQVGYMMDNTSKTRAIFEINKGNGVPVNARVAEEDRRIPMLNMIYIADGPSDVPVFSLLMKNGGRNLGVYQSKENSNYQGVKQLQDEGRVHSIAPADFREDTPAYLWLTTTIKEIAERICTVREQKLSSFQAPAGHVTGQPATRARSS